MTTIRKIDPYPPPINFLIVHISNSAEGSLRILEFYEGKSTWLAGLKVRDHAYFDYAAESREGGVELFFGGGEG